MPSHLALRHFVILSATCCCPDIRFLRPRAPNSSNIHIPTIISYLMSPNNKVRGNRAFHQHLLPVCPFASPPSGSHEKQSCKGLERYSKCHGMIQLETAKGDSAMAGIEGEELTKGVGGGDEIMAEIEG